MSIRNALIPTLAAATLLAACSSEPTIQTGDDAETIMGGTLAKVDNAAVDLAYVDPAGNYDRYDRVWIVPLDVDNIEIIQPKANASMVNRYNNEWELTDADKERLQKEFNESMTKELTSNGDFEVADGPGDDVIKVEAMITAIAPSGPKDDTASRGIGRSVVITEGSGAMAIAIMLADGDSGEVLAVIKDTRNSTNANWGINNSVTNLAELRRNFNAWSAQIHRGLVGLRALAENQ